MQITTLDADDSCKPTGMPCKTRTAKNSMNVITARVARGIYGIDANSSHYGSRDQNYNSGCSVRLHYLACQGCPGVLADLFRTVLSALWHLLHLKLHSHTRKCRVKPRAIRTFGAFRSTDTLESGVSLNTSRPFESATP